MDKCGRETPTLTEGLAKEAPNSLFPVASLDVDRFLLSLFSASKSLSDFARLLYIERR